MPHKMVLTQDEQNYVEQALRAGNMELDDIYVVLLVARLMKMNPMEVQSNYMDVRIGVQQTLRKGMHLPPELRSSNPNEGE